MAELLLPNGATECGAAGSFGKTVLSGDLGIRDAETLRGRLTQVMTDGGRLRVDLGGVTAIDTSIVQILIAARRNADDRGGVFEIEGFDKSPLPEFLAAIGLTTDDLYNGPPATGRYDAEPVLEPALKHGDADDLFWLSDDQIALLRPYFPKSAGKRRVDDKRVLSGIIYVKRNGLRWQDAPEAYGPYKTLYTRWKRWKDTGVFQRMMEALSSDEHGQAPAGIDASWLQVLSESQAD